MRPQGLEILQDRLGIPALGLESLEPAQMSSTFSGMQSN